MKIVVIDDTPMKIIGFKYSCGPEGIPQEDIVEVNCLGIGSEQVRAIIKKRISEIKAEQEEVVLVLDWGFSSSNRDLLAEEIFYDLTEGILEEGDAIICNGDCSQFSNYKKFLEGKKKECKSVEVKSGNRMIETEGILIISPKDWNPINGLNEIIRFKSEGDAEANTETTSGIETEISNLS